MTRASTQNGHARLASPTRSPAEKGKSIGDESLDFQIRHAFSEVLPIRIALRRRVDTQIVVHLFDARGVLGDRTGDGLEFFRRYLTFQANFALDCIRFDFEE